MEIILPNRLPRRILEANLTERRMYAQDVSRGTCWEAEICSTWNKCTVLEGSNLHLQSPSYDFPFHCSRNRRLYPMPTRNPCCLFGILGAEPENNAPIAGQRVVRP